MLCWGYVGVRRWCMCLCVGEGRWEGLCNAVLSVLPCSVLVFITRGSLLTRPHSTPCRLIACTSITWLPSWACQLLFAFLTAAAVAAAVLLQHSRRDLPGCGPESVVGTLFPRTVGAALSQLVELLGSSLDGAQKVFAELGAVGQAWAEVGVIHAGGLPAGEGTAGRRACPAAVWCHLGGGLCLPAARPVPPVPLAPLAQMERTLTRTWLPPVKRGVEASLVQRSLEMLRDRIAQHEAAWGSGDTLDDGGNGGGARAAGGPLAGMPEGHQGGGADGGGSSGAGAPPGRQRLLDEAWLRQLVRKTPLAAAPIITFVNLKASCCLCPCTTLLTGPRCRGGVCSVGVLLPPRSARLHQAHPASTHPAAATQHLHLGTHTHSVVRPLPARRMAAGLG